MEWSHFEGRIYCPLFSDYFSPKNVIQTYGYFRPPDAFPEVLGKGLKLIYNHYNIVHCVWYGVSVITVENLLLAYGWWIDIVCVIYMIRYT